MAARARATHAGEATPTIPPYDPLPVLGHVAIYTLNLILLRTYLAEEFYSLEERDLDAGSRPWDRLTGLWRSWFSRESLGALANGFTATRRENRLTLRPTKSEALVDPTAPLDISYNAAIALADDLAAVTAGLHVMSLTVRPDRPVFDALLTRLTGEAVTLSPIADVMASRLFADGAQLPDAAYKALGDPFIRHSAVMLEFAELADRMALSPHQRGLVRWQGPDMLDTISVLSRYGAELVANARAEMDPYWLHWLLYREPGLRPEQDREAGQVWQEFLASPAAAPVLRAAVRRLSSLQCAELAEKLRGRLSDGDLEFYDVDTAAALAVLAWRGADIEMCTRWIDAIVLRCECGEWNALDIPLGTWGDLADLFGAAGPDIASRRERFAALVDSSALQMPGTPALRAPFVEFSLQAMRIGVVQDRDAVFWEVVRWITGDQELRVGARRWFLLLLRWARENDETRVATDILCQAPEYRVGAWWTLFDAVKTESPEWIDLDRVCQELTYREAMDLHWALDLWRAGS